ncbi:MAG: 3-isopropylmalate dehydratase small subunit [Acidobacteriota bacterium]
MEKFTTFTGTAAPLLRANIDTDQIIPKQFLKRIERTGYGQFLFYDWSHRPDGSVIADFALNDPRYSDASILIAGANFGCGSSREHAPWSLLDRGFRVVVAPSFAGIFYSNCLKNGLLPIVLEREDVDFLGKQAIADAEYPLTINLYHKMISGPNGFSRSFKIDDFQRNCLLNGLDDIGLTLEFEDKITAYEARHFPAASFSLR